jgi:ABC-type multidrug transport system ATPase subunit
LEGEIYLDNNRIDPSSRELQNKIASIGQNDTLLPTAVPREAIQFAARLRVEFRLRVFFFYLGQLKYS